MKYGPQHGKWQSENILYIRDNQACSGQFARGYRALFLTQRVSDFLSVTTERKAGGQGLKHAKEQGFALLLLSAPRDDSSEIFREAIAR